MNVFRTFPGMVVIGALAFGCGGRQTTDTQTADSEESKSVSTAALNLTAERVTPGGRVEGTISIKVPEGWHTYSDPPGDSGMAPIINFRLPADWDASVLPLPAAKTFKDDAGITFGYEDGVDIRFRITAPAGAVSGQDHTIGVSIQWLTCKEICLPWSAEFEKTLTVAGGTENQGD